MSTRSMESPGIRIIPDWLVVHVSKNLSPENTKQADTVFRAGLFVYIVDMFFKCGFGNAQFILYSRIGNPV